MTELDAVKKHVWKLRDSLSGRFAVLFSGGIDSGVIAYAARDFADALTVSSGLTFEHKIEDAVNFSLKYGITHKVVKFSIDEETKSNTSGRCYFCKKNMLREIKNLGYNIILDGSNADDLKENRQGIKALREENVISPLLELNFGKKEVFKAMTEIDREFALKPHESCIATRIPVNSKITSGRLKRIEAAEEYIRSLGAKIVRVRDYFPEAKIEFSEHDFNLMFENREKIARKFKSMGYEEVFLNLEPYKRVL